MNRNSKVIKGIGVVALSGVVATSALTLTSCGISINKHNEQKMEAQRQEEESKSKVLAEELEQAKNDLLAYISDDTYVEDKTTYKDKIQSADEIDRINEIKADYEAEVQEIKAEEAARVAAEAARAIKEFEAAKTKAKSTISNTNYITADIASNYKEKVDEATSQEEIDSILEEVATVSNNNKTAKRPGGFSVGGSTPVGGGSGTSQPVDEHEGMVYDEEIGKWVHPSHLGEGRGTDGTTIDWGSAGTLGDNWSHYNN